MATKTKKAPRNIIVSGYNQLKGYTSDINEFALTTAEDVVNGVVTEGEKWSNLTNKAVKGGLKLADKQQDMILDNLEVVRDRMVKNTKRAFKLFSFSNN